MGRCATNIKMNIISMIFSVLAGIIGSMGLGGGSILIIYLTAILFMDQTKAQGINVLFFIPCAAYALIFYFRNKLIIKEAVIPMILSGVIGVFIGLYVLSFLKPEMLSKFFGFFLVILAIKDLIQNILKNRSDKTI